MEKKIKLSLDTSKSRYESCECKQNDDLLLEVDIFENGVSKDLTNTDIVINCTRADKTFIVQNTDIIKENNKLTASLVRDFTRVPGNDKLEIVLVEDEKQNTTFDFNILVKKSVLEGAVESDNVVTIIEELENKIVEAGQVKETTEDLILNGGAAPKEDIIKINASLEQKAQQIDLIVERERINQLAKLPSGSTTGDAELIDGRVGANGNTYANIGNAIRGQFDKLEKTLTNQIYGSDFLESYSNLEVVSNGYIKGSGGISTGQVDTSSTSHKILTIPIKNLKSIKLVRGASDVSSSMIYGDIYDSVNNKVYYSFNITNVDNLVMIQKEWREKAKLRLNWFNYATSPYVKNCNINYIDVSDIATDIINEKEKNIDKNIYNHCVNKPFIFNNKSALFFGDSITKGFTSGSSTTPNGFPKLFSDKVGMIFTNYGVGGSCLSYNYNNLGSVLDKITSVGALTNDFLFIAGGVNDWQLAVDLDTFKAGVIAICEYLKTNYTGKVIFITPINHGGRTPTNTPVADLQEYRNIITEVVLKYSNFSVVQGNLFNMPNEKSSDDYINSMFGDKLHPTELGYTVYARELATILC